jgi:hypothetical protein
MALVFDCDLVLNALQQNTWEFSDNNHQKGFRAMSHSNFMKAVCIGAFSKNKYMLFSEKWEKCMVQNNKSDCEAILEFYY